MSLKDTVRKGLTILWLNLKFSVVLYLWKWFSRPMAYLSTICEMRSLRGSCSGRYVSHPWDKIPGMTFPLKPMLDYGEWSEHGSKGWFGSWPWISGGDIGGENSLNSRSLSKTLAFKSCLFSTDWGEYKVYRLQQGSEIKANVATTTGLAPGEQQPFGLGF